MLLYLRLESVISVCLVIIFIKCPRQSVQGLFLLINKLISYPTKPHPYKTNKCDEKGTYVCLLSRRFQPFACYCRFANFRENFIFANSIKRHISDVKNSRLRQDLPMSINERVILPFRVGFIFAKLRICEVSRK